MLEVEIVPVLSDNFCYLVICGETKRAAAIDPAQPEPVLARADQLGVELVAIWNTHHHFDHTGGNEALLAKKKVDVYGPADSHIPGRTHDLDEGDTIELGNLTAKVIATPGHTLDGICYHVEDALFSGDALFAAGCGRLFEGDAEMMYESLNVTLAHLPDETRLFFGHEYTEKNLGFAVDVDPENAELRARFERVKAQRPRGEHTTPSTLGVERATNPFLRCGDEALRAALRARDGGKLDNNVAVFAKLRSLRDNW
ncbi:MAG: hydroxyacylglutathione hydrolase [Myxococcales bacterium]|nr:hydroxyacylglutathione hydrolase [Myxococcales bacterium]